MNALAVSALQLAQINLEQLRAYKPTTDHDRRHRAHNITQVEAWIAENGGGHPSRGSR